MIRNAEGQLYLREYQELPQFTNMFNKIAKSKTQEIRFKCSYDEPMPTHIIREQTLRLNIREQFRQMDDTELAAQNTVDHRADRNIILEVEKKRRIKMKTKKQDKIVMNFKELIKLNDKTYYKIWYKEFLTLEDCKTWMKRHVLAYKKETLIVNKSFISFTGLRNYTKSVRI